MSFPDADARRSAALRWQPPDGTRVITTFEAHAEGEPLRVVLAGIPELRAGRANAMRLQAQADLEFFRRALMWEPRGHADMYGCLVLPPADSTASAAVLFLHNEGWSTMCGHGVLAVSRVLLETGIVARREPETHFALDTPAGNVHVSAQIRGGVVGPIRFVNVASWVQELDASVSVDGLGAVPFDLAFGGAFYAFVDAARLGIELVPEHTSRLIDLATRIKAAAATALPPVHPTDPSLSFLYGVIFISPPVHSDHHSRHVCVFADGEVDRSPTGTGVSARAAILHSRRELAVGEEIVIESIIGSRFSVRIEAVADEGPAGAIIPQVGGRVAITGRSEWFIEPDDPLRSGFLLR